MDAETLLTTTRSARKSLDLAAPVNPDDITDCLTIALQAANGSNQQSWRWLVLYDDELRRAVAEQYRLAYLERVGGQMISHLMSTDSPEGKLMASTEWLVEHMADVPALVIPCYLPTMPRVDGDELFYAATLYGSIFPAVWNFQLALHNRGYGTCMTTLHLSRAEAISRMLAIPDGYLQACLMPVGRLRSGRVFRAAQRRPTQEVMAVDGWTERTAGTAETEDE